jgi:S1-C subfamily serine protease
MQKAILFFRFLKGPAILGLLIALILLLVFPEKFPNSLRESLQEALTPDATENDQLQAFSYANAVEKASVSVVNIYTLRQQAVNTRYNPLTGRYSGSENKILPSTGSGVIVSEEGYIITNLHVLESAKDIRVALQDGREATPEIVGFSKEDDMAVLKINLEGLQAIEIGNPDEARVGDVVLAIGNPVGVGQTVTQGIISGTRRKGLQLSTFENFIQTDAAINPGNSGGALVDAYGRLLGINIGDLRQTYFGEASGIGFAIPADRAIQAVNDIVEHGRVVRGCWVSPPWTSTTKSWPLLT